MNRFRVACFVKGEARKMPLFCRLSWIFDFLRCARSVGIPVRDPLLNIKSPVFANSPSKSASMTTCLSNAPAKRCLLSGPTLWRIRKIVPGINFWKITDFFLRDGPCLELIIVSSNFQALLLLRDKLLESVWKRLIPVKRSWKLLDPPFSELIQ